MTMTVPKVEWEGEVYTRELLDADEERLLRTQLFGYLAANNSFLMELFRDMYPVIKYGAEVAKNDLKAVFRGLFAGDSEIGMSMIRPNHVLRTTGATETNTNDWTVTLTADDDYWIGFGTNNTTAINIDKRLCVVPLGVWFTQGGNPTVEELYIQVGAVTYPVQVIRHAWVADNPHGVRACRIRPMIWKPKSRPLVQTYSINAAVQEMILVGVSFGMGDLLRTQAPTTVQT